MDNPNCWFKISNCIFKPNSCACPYSTQSWVETTQRFFECTTESLSILIVVGRLVLKLNNKHPSIFISPPTQMQLHLIPLCVFTSSYSWDRQFLCSSGLIIYGKQRVGSVPVLVCHSLYAWRDLRVIASATSALRVREVRTLSDPFFTTGLSSPP